MIRRIFGGIIAAAGLLLVFVTANELWRTLDERAILADGIASRVVTLTGIEAAGPAGILIAAFMGGLLFVIGCVIVAPQQK